jgi:membrane protease YdiL (CAAX protease family)
MSFYEKLQNPKNALGTSFFVMVIFGFMVIISQIISQYLIVPLGLDYIVELVISFVIQFTFAGLTCLIIIPFLLKVPQNSKPYKEYLQSIHFTNIKPIGKILFIGLTGTVFVLFFSLFVTSIPGNLLLTPEMLFGAPERSITMGWFRFIHNLIPGIWEEVYARGILLAILLRRYPREEGKHHKAILIGGLIFGLTHMLDIPRLITNPIYIGVQVIYSSIIGIAFGYIAVGTKSLLPSILIHWMIDTFTVYITPVPADDIMFLILFMAGVIIASGLIIALVYQSTDLSKYNKKKIRNI